MTTDTVGYLIGNLAKGSIHHQLAQAPVKLAPSALVFTGMPIKDLTLYTATTTTRLSTGGMCFQVGHR